MGGAFLCNTDLSGAKLRGTGLSSTWLLGANLSGASLLNSNLNGAHLERADLFAAVYEAGGSPRIRGIATAKNLGFVAYLFNPDSLFELRKQFKDRGFGEQDRKITYALNRRETEILLQGFREDTDLLKGVHYLSRKAFFDFTSQYGMNPGRLLISVAVLWFICSFIYWLFIQHRGLPACTLLARYYGREKRGYG